MSDSFFLQISLHQTFLLLIFLVILSFPILFIKSRFIIPVKILLVIVFGLLFFYSAGSAGIRADLMIGNVDPLFGDSWLVIFGFLILCLLFAVSSIYSAIIYLVHHKDQE